MLEKPFTVGGEGSGSDPDIYALLLKNAFGAKLKLISGYPGTAEIAIALERGEVDCARELVVVELEGAAAALDHREEGALSGAAQPRQGRGIAGRAADHRVRQERAAAADAQARPQPAGHGPAVHGAARHSGRPAAALRKAFDETWTDPEFMPR